MTCVCVSLVLVVDVYDMCMCFVMILLSFTHTCSFTALFSTTRRKQLEMSLADSSPHRPIFTPANAGMASTESEEPE